MGLYTKADANSDFVVVVFFFFSLTRDEYRQLVGNMDAVLDTHSKLLMSLEACNDLAPQEQRVGKLFLNSAPQIKQIHLSYCSSHPRAVCILNKYK